MAIFVACFKKKEDISVEVVKSEPKPERIYTFPKPEPVNRNQSLLEVQSKTSEIVVVDSKKQVSALTDGVIKLLSSVVLEYKSDIVDQVSIHFFKVLLKSN